MNPSESVHLPPLAEVEHDVLARALAGKGIWLDVGAAQIRVQSDSPELIDQIKTVYGHFPFVDKSDWADAHLRILRARGLRRWIRPQVMLYCDGQLAFDPFPADSPLPLMEWGANWLIAHRLQREAQILAALSDIGGSATVGQIASLVYTDLPSGLLIWSRQA